MATIVLQPRVARGLAHRGIDRWTRLAAALVVVAELGLVGAYVCLIGVVCSAALGGVP